VVLQFQSNAEDDSQEEELTTANAWSLKWLRSRQHKIIDKRMLKSLEAVCCVTCKGWSAIKELLRTLEFRDSCRSANYKVNSCDFCKGRRCNPVRNF